MRDKINCKNVIRVIAFILEIICFLPTMAVSCGGNSKGLSVLDIMVGVGNEETTYTEPELICVIALIVPLVLLFGWMKMKEGQENQKRIWGLFIATGVDLIFWIYYRSKFTETAKSFYCTAETLKLYYLNLILLIVVLLLLGCVLLRILTFEQPIVEGIEQIKSGKRPIFGQNPMQQEFYGNPSEHASLEGQEAGEQVKTAQRYCTSCGKPLDEHVAFCPNCGAKVGQPVQPAATISPVEANSVVTKEAPKKSKKKLIVGITVALVAVIAVIAVWIVLNLDEILDLEEYMSKNKQEWIDIGFQGEDDYEVYYDGDDTTIMFEEGKPYILTIKKESIYNFHGVKIGDTKSDVENIMKDNYEAVEGGEDELVYKSKSKDIWVGFEMEGDVVSQILSTTDETLLNVEGGWSEDEGILEDTDENVSEEMDIVDIPDFSGSWVEPISQRCNMEIICQNDAYYEITIDWGSSAWDNTHWEFTGEYDATQGGIVYKNGCRYEQHYPEDGSDMQQTEVYSDGEGFIYIKDEELYWEDKKEGTGEAQAFVRPDVLETSISEEFPDADYVLPDSDTVRLTEEDIADLSLQEINYAKNEIYARHGRKFQSKELRDYFNSKDWYVGTIDGADFDDGVLSQIERDNIKLLTNAEFSMDPNGYQLDQ